ncbi:MAG: ATP-binding protein [Bryobacteraceae bacterium]
MNTRQVWSDLPLRGKGVVVGAIPFFALLLATFVTYTIERQRANSEAWISHTLEVRSNLQQVFTLELDAQSAIRGYRATHDELLLGPYHKAVASLPAVLGKTVQLVTDNPSQKTRAFAMVHLAMARLNELTELYHRAQKERAEKVPLNQAIEWTAIDPLRVQLESMLAIEDQLLDMRRVWNQKTDLQMRFMLLVSVALGLVGGLIVNLLFTSGIGRRISLIEKNAQRLATGDPMLHVAPAKDEIGRLHVSLQKAAELLARKSRGLKLAMASARLALWELDVASGQLRYEFTDGIERYPTTVLEWQATLDAPNLLLFQSGLQTMENTMEACEFNFSVTKPDGNRAYYLIRGQVRENGFSSIEKHGQKLLGVLMDVTHAKVREQIEIELRQTTDLLRLLVESVKDYAIFLLDPNGVILTWSSGAERLKGWTAEEIIGKPFFSLYPPEDLANGKTELELIVAAKEGRYEDYGWRVRKDGSRFWANVIITSLRDKDGALRGFGKVTRDLTERRRAEQLLESAKQEADASNQAKNEFLSRMSHELRTPLNSIFGFAQVLRMGTLSSGQLDCVEHILKASKHLLALIDELLDISRIEAGTLHISVEALDIAQSVRQALDMMRPIAVSSGIQICDAPKLDSNQYVKADRQRLQQVLLNLLSNAIKYNRPAGKVEVCSENMASCRVRIKISDTGLGIPPEFQNRVFVPFDRLNAHQTDVQGTGLGLALSRKLVELMGGCIGVESEPGSGSAFWIDLPSTEGPSKRIESEGVPSKAVPQSWAVTTVLCVDDNTANQHLMERIFEHRPQTHLLFAMQGSLALELAMQHAPDLIFLDLHLPDLNGDIVLQRLRAHPVTKNIPIVMLSADGTPGQIQKLIDLGASDYVTKPLDIPMLLAVVDRYAKNPKTP